MERRDSILDVIYEDNHLLAVVKPSGVLSQGDRTGDQSSFELAKQYIKEKYRRPGNVFLGLVHRLDRPASGVLLFARTSKAASRLARAFQQRQVEKRYLAVVEGRPPHEEDTITGFIEREEKCARLRLERSARAKESQLSYRVLEHSGAFTLVEVVPLTGRHHQIRVQLSGEGCPVAGDVLYGAEQALPDRSIALHCARLVVSHPTRREPVSLSAPPPRAAPWKRFDATIRGYFATDA